MESPFVIDIGANDGLYAERISTLVGPKGRIHVVEPQRSMKARLEFLTKSCENLTFGGYAVGAHEGIGNLEIPLVDGQVRHRRASLARPPAFTNAVEEPVRVRTLDSVTIELGWVPSLLVIDVEGYELEVLQGARCTLAGQPTLIIEIEERHSPGTFYRTTKYLREIGYEIFAISHTGLIALNKFDLMANQVAHNPPVPWNRVPPEYTNNFYCVAIGSASGENAEPPHRGPNRE